MDKKSIISLVILGISIIAAIYVLIVGEPPVRDSQKSSGENTQSGELQEENIIPNVFYELSSGENEVYLAVSGESSKYTTIYQFENDELIGISAKIEMKNEEVANEEYQRMLIDGAEVERYENISVSGNVISISLRKEFVDAFGKPSKSMVYNEQQKQLEKINKFGEMK